MPVKIRVTSASDDERLCGLLGDRLWFRCSACVRSGLRGAEKRRERRLEPLLSIVAAMDAYGPVAVSVELATPAMRARLAELIPDGDPRREQRREYFDRLRASCAPVNPHSGVACS